MYPLVTLYHLMYHIDEVSLPYSTEFEKDISMKDDLISYDLDIAVISASRSMDSCLRRNERNSFSIPNYLVFIIQYSLHPVPELWKSLPDGRIEVSVRLLRYIEHRGEHILRIGIETCSTIFVEGIEPVIRDKSGKSRFKISKSLLYTLKYSPQISLCMERDLQVCSDDIERVSLHIKTLIKTSKNAIKKSPFRGIFRGIPKMNEQMSRMHLS